MTDSAASPSPSQFSDLPSQEQDWLDDYLDGTIEPKAFEALQDRMLESSALRAVARRYLALDNSLQNESSDAESSTETATGPWLNLETEPAAPSPEPTPDVATTKLLRFPSIMPLAAAAALAFLLGTAIMYWKVRPSGGSDGAIAQASEEEPSAEGFAVIERLYGATFSDKHSDHREGDTLGAEVFHLASGTAKIQFFSGANMTVEGPAEISLKSAWEASCVEGAVRMQVPPAARGFKLQAPATEIVDLGTEFGLVVRDGEGHVEVFDGEIAVRHRGAAEQLVKKGSALGLSADQPVVERQTGTVTFPDAKRFGSQVAEQELFDFQNWQKHRDTLAADDRLIAYYTFDRETPESLIPNLTVPRNPEFDGAVILAEPVDGRWAERKSALEFRRPGSRVRVNLPGEFPALTFVGWVRIDSLDRWYNALFMSDGYETGEPHWQIKENGQMMLSVMVDDTWTSPKYPNVEGLAHIYYSPPIWNPSMSGQWLHLASVFDPETARVSHYLNGRRISQDVIKPEHLIKTLRIGNAEIGNWGQPFREDPTFAIRNLNGRMDELAIFRTALDEEAITQLYEDSRSGRR